jgi:hypothetical protein
MAKWKELPPSPEAIVRAALERAASDADQYGEQSYAAKMISASIRSLASNPTKVAAILKAAGEDR